MKIVIEIDLEQTMAEGMGHDGKICSHVVNAQLKEAVQALDDSLLGQHLDILGAAIEICSQAPGVPRAFMEMRIDNDAPAFGRISFSDEPFKKETQIPVTSVVKICSTEDIKATAMGILAEHYTKESSDETTN